MIYTTNEIESLNYSLRRVLKNRSLFPTDDAVYKLLFLAIRNAAKKWTMPIRNWRGAMQQFAIVYGDGVRLPVRAEGLHHHKLKINHDRLHKIIDTTEKFNCQMKS